MARKFLVPIDLTVNELQNAVIQNLASDPASGNVDGRIYYNTTADKLRVYANGSWIDVGAITDIQGTTNEIEVSIVGGVATIGLPSTITAALNGNASTATALQTARNIALGGDLSGTASFNGTSDITITATIGANSVALGTDTTGDYVTGVTASDGIAATGTGEGASVALTNTDKGSSQNIFKNISDGSTSVVADSNNDTVIFSGGTGISVTANATTDTMTIGNTGVTSIAGTTDQISLSGSTGSVTVSLPSAVVFPGSVTLHADPTQALHAVTKQYVDGLTSGLDWHPAVNLLANSNVALTGTSGTLVIDGHAALGDGDDGYRILLKNQTTDSEEGIYVYSDNGSTYTLSRAADADAYGELVGAAVFVMEGTTYGATSWVQSNHYLSSFAGQTWTQFSGTGTYAAGNGLTLTGNSFSIDTTITADVNTAQTLSNKTLTSPSISGLYLSDNSFVVEGTADAFETTVQFTDPTADRTITFQNASGTVAFTQDITDAIDAITTTVIEEGTNLYFTDERAQDAVGNMLLDGTTVNFTYNDGTPSITAEVILATTSYLSTTGGLSVDTSALASAGFTKKYAATITGDNSANSFALTHGLGTADAIVTVYDTGTTGSPSTATLVETDVTITNTTATITFATAPATNKTYRVVVVG